MAMTLVRLAGSVANPLLVSPQDATGMNVSVALELGVEPTALLTITE